MSTLILLDRFKEKIHLAIGAHSKWDEIFELSQTTATNVVVIRHIFPSCCLNQMCLTINSCQQASMQKQHDPHAHVREMNAEQAMMVKSCASDLWIPWLLSELSSSLVTYHVDVGKVACNLIIFVQLMSAF